MKVRLLKDLPHCKAWEYEVIKDGEVYLKDINNNLNLSIIFNWWLYNKDFFEQIEEPTEFKLWDKVMFLENNNKAYWIITWLDIENKSYFINWVWWDKNDFVLCSEREIELYFN
jgi:hypothetical protein